MPAMAVAASPPVFSSSVQRREPLCFFSFLLLLCLSVLSFSPSLSVSLSFSLFPLVLPCIYRQKTGETSWWGGHCWPPPPLPFPWITTLGNGGRLFAQKTGKKVGEKGEEKSSSSPASRVQGKKKTYSAVKTAPFWASVFFFFATVNETAPFWSKRAISFKRKRRQNASDFKEGLQFARVLQFGPWSQISSIKSLIGH